MENIVFGPMGTHMAELDQVLVQVCSKTHYKLYHTQDIIKLGNFLMDKNRTGS